MQFNKEIVQEVRKEINHALQQVSDRYDVNFNVSKIKYDVDYFSAQLECFVGNPEESARAEFEKHCKTYGFNKEHYQAQFTSGGQVYRLIGFKHSARKYSCLCENVITGEKIRFTTSIKKLL